MSYANFIPGVWAETIEHELERLCVFAEDCNRSYEDSVKKRGESVTILGVGKPTIKTLAKKARNGAIDDAETVEDTSVTLEIDQIRYFNYEVGDIDKAQAVGGIMDALAKETSEGLACAEDSHIASFAADTNVMKLYGNTPKKIVAGDAGDGEVNVLHAIDEAIQKLYENDVSANTKLVITVSPRFYTIFKRAYVGLDTDNSEMLKNGRVGMHGDVVVKRSNNVHKSADGSVDHIMIRTQRAVAHVRAMVHTEAYRPEKKFSDAVKGFTLFGTKVVRPKEMIDINVKYA